MDVLQWHIDPQSPLYQILIGSAVVTTVINVTWFVVSSSLNAIARRARLRVQLHEFALGRGITRQEYEDLSKNISAFYCLLVRYGTDDYMMKLANDGERFEGRQQLKLFRIEATFDKSGLAVFKLRLPIHKTLGTQFKCFVEARTLEHAPAALAALKKCDRASDVKQSDSYHRTRIYFLLDQFMIIDTVNAGIQNNYIFPE
jgi:hypothetical protein